MTAEKNARAVCNALSLDCTARRDTEFDLCRLVEKCLRVFETRRWVPRSRYWSEMVIGGETWEWWDCADGDTVRELVLALVNATRVRKGGGQPGKPRTGLFERLDDLSRRLAEEKDVWHAQHSAGHGSASWTYDFDSKAEDEADVAARRDDEAIMRSLVQSELEAEDSDVDSAPGVRNEDGAEMGMGAGEDREKEFDALEADPEVDIMMALLAKEETEGTFQWTSHPGSLPPNPSNTSPTRQTSSASRIRRKPGLAAVQTTDELRHREVEHRGPISRERRQVMAEEVKLPIRPKNEPLFRFTADDSRPATKWTFSIASLSLPVLKRHYIFGGKRGHAEQRIGSVDLRFGKRIKTV